MYSKVFNQISNCPMDIHSDNVFKMEITTSFLNSSFSLLEVTIEV